MPHISSTATTPYIATGTASTATVIFNRWVTTNATTTTATIWTAWTDCITTGTGTYVVTVDNDTPTVVTLPAPPTPEQQAELAAARARVEAEARQADKDRRRANRRAMLTLLQFIRPEQRDEFRRHGHFYVRGGATGRRYRINRGRVANIDVLDGNGLVDHRLCAHPNLAVPDYDTMLAQALFLEAPEDEEAFVRTANIHPRPTRQPTPAPAAILTPA